MTVNLTIVSSYPWDICFDLQPLPYTQKTQFFKADYVFFRMLGPINVSLSNKIEDSIFYRSSAMKLNILETNKKK